MNKRCSQIFDEEHDGSEDGIKRQIDRENKLKRGVLHSIIQWRRIIEEMDGSFAGSGKTENEYRVRYFYQHQYNQLLNTEITNLKYQRKCLSDDKQTVFNETTILQHNLPQLRSHLRELKREKCSLNSQISMNERQLDRESMAFHKIRKSCDTILNDVIFQQKNQLEQQEKFDKQFFKGIRQNLHSTLFGTKHKSRTSCLGLAASRSAFSSSHVVNSHTRIKSGVENHRLKSCENKIVSKDNGLKTTKITSTSKKSYLEDKECRISENDLSNISNAHSSQKKIIETAVRGNKGTANDKSEDRVSENPDTAATGRFNRVIRTITGLKNNPVVEAVDSGKTQLITEEEENDKTVNKPKPSILPSTWKNNKRKPPHQKLPIIHSRQVSALEMKSGKKAEVESNIIRRPKAENLPSAKKLREKSSKLGKYL